MLISHERLLECLHYDPETGVFTWRIKPKSNNAQIGDQAGSRGEIFDKRTGATGKFRIHIGIDNGNYNAARLAWFYVTGEWPPDQIDHRDTDAINNRWVNLRLADNSRNGANKPVRRDSSTGVKGVFAKSGRKSGYEVRITVRGKKLWLAYVTDPADGAPIYAAAAKRYFGEFARIEESKLDLFG